MRHLDSPSMHLLFPELQSITDVIFLIASPAQMSPSSPKYSPTSPTSPSSPKYCEYMSKHNEHRLTLSCSPHISCIFPNL